MSKFERVLSDVVLTLAERSFSFDVEDHHKEIVRFAERLEQAVLQSPEIQALRKDAERYRYIKRGNRWIVATTQTGVQVAGEELDDLIDNEMEQKNDQ